MMKSKQLLSIGALSVAAILLIFLVIVMAAPGLMPGSILESPGDDDGLNQPNDNETNQTDPAPLPTNLIETNQTTVTLNEEGAVRIGFSGSADNYSAVQMTLSFERNDVVDINDISGVGVGNFEVVEQQTQSVTFKVDQINGTQNTFARMSVEGSSIGSTGIVAQVHTLMDDDSTITNRTFSAGNVVVDSPRPSITIQRPSITYTDQPQVGKQVTVRQATLPEGGFVVLYDRTDNGSLGDEIAHSAYLEPGVRTDITLSTDRLVRSDQEVTARLHYDKNNNQVWDGNKTDTKFPSFSRNVTVNSTALSVQFVTRVDVVLTNLTNGLQKYRIELSASPANQTPVSEVTPNRITGADFTVIDGGLGSQRVEVQGVDIDNQVEPSSGNMTLFTVAFVNDHQLYRDQLTLQPLDVEDDDANPIPSENVTAEIRCSSPFDGPVAGQPQFGEPIDPDCDGLFEDVNGDGRLTSDDVQALALVKDADLPDEQIDALDFNGNGTLEFADITRLKNETQQNSEVSSS